MEPNKLLDILHTAERLKDTLRHCDTSKGRRESVAEHSWRLALMAFFLRDEFSDTDMDRVIRMCLIHDLGECFTGDIPSFLKTDADTEKEDALLERLLHQAQAAANDFCRTDFDADAPEPARLAVLLMASHFYEYRDASDRSAYLTMINAFHALLYPYRKIEDMF